MGKIKGFLETSFIDWPGRVCAVLFLSGCNFRCPFCHNHPLVLNPAALESLNLAKIRLSLAPFKKWLGGICISGGEPTLSPQLPDIIRQLKNDGWQIKLDTNGSQPEKLLELINDKLLDMISMDIKAPLNSQKYNNCTGVNTDLDKIRESIILIQKSGLEHEFRMTVLPSLHTESDITDCAASLGSSPLKLQNFNPGTTLNLHFIKEKRFSPEIFKSLQKLVA
jgi:pyruvate formate lyase activating enzyme